VIKMQTGLFSSPKKVKVLNLPFPTGRLIAVGDVHGCLEELKELVDALKINNQDTLVFLGDLIDRGLHSEGVVQYIKALSDQYSVYNVASNHDEKVVRYHFHQLRLKEDPNYKVPMRVPNSYFNLSESSLEFLAKCPHAVFIDNKDTDEKYPICFVHAGLSPSLFNQDPKAFVRNRYFTRNVKDNRLTPVRSIEIDGVWFVPEGSSPWYHFWDGRWTVVYGHAVNWHPLIENNTIGIDAGCCFGGNLRAWIKNGENSYFFDVESRQK
jgi:diadenosine tetraphosphatase ApaH/serine/threonine PP2A family protein phosphatase